VCTTIVFKTKGPSIHLRRLFVTQKDVDGLKVQIVLPSFRYIASSGFLFAAFERVKGFHRVGAVSLAFQKTEKLTPQKT
jgi:hypothetical protein